MTVETLRQRGSEWNSRNDVTAVDVLGLGDPPPLRSVMAGLPATSCGRRRNFCHWMFDGDEVSKPCHPLHPGHAGALGYMPDRLSTIEDLGEVLIDFGAEPCSSTVGAALRALNLAPAYAIEEIAAWRRMGARFASRLGIQVVELLPVLAGMPSATLLCIHVLNTRPAVAAITAVSSTMPVLYVLRLAEQSFAADRVICVTCKGSDNLEAALAGAGLYLASPISQCGVGERGHELVECSR